MARKGLDLSVLTKATESATYPSEQGSGTSHAHEIEKLVPGGRIKGKRVIIEDAASTVLWDGNPRNLEEAVDVDTLVELVRLSGGNTTPVDGRKKADGTIEIVAGKRRRQACIKAGLPLAVDLYENMTDEMANFITDAENRGREALGIFAESEYLNKRLIERRKKDFYLTIPAFAADYAMSERSMKYRLAIASLPDDIRTIAKKQSEWSQRKAIDFSDLCIKLLKSGVEQDIIVEAMSGAESPTKIIAAVRAIKSKSKLNENTKPESQFNLSAGKVIVKHNRTGGMKVLFNKHVDEETKEKVIDFIAQLSSD